MDPTRLIHSVAARAGTDADDARRILVATLCALQAYPEAPPAILDPLMPDDKRIELGSEPSFDELIAWVSGTQGVQTGVALEWVDAALTEVAAALPDDARRRLRDGLPDAYATRLVDPQPEGAVPHAAAPPRANTLAAGTPGARNSLASGAPHGSHRRSIAESDDPYAGRTLASAEPRDDEE